METATAYLIFYRMLQIISDQWLAWAYFSREMKDKGWQFTAYVTVTKIAVLLTIF